ncbi:SDR family oxidoreductase [Denitromonas sp.]|uniref:SDR family oxidoreductase n=1 Tax=Denitromonas sp. TaxID=2734609 RepID=UPI003A876707
MSRTILITGATGKVGSTLTAHFLAQGHKVIAVSRSQEALDALASQQQARPGRLYTIAADLMASDACQNITDTLSAMALTPDGLINNARSISFLGIESSGQVRRDNFMNEFQLDVIAPYELTMALARMQGSRLTSVVNIGSQYGIVAPNLKLYEDPARQSPIHYGVAKAALAHLTKELAVRLAEQHIRVNCVAFGGVEGRVNPAFKARYAELCPSGRMLREDELPGPVDLLLSDAASAITGHVMMADGGWSLW